MSNKRYIEIASGYRNRTQWPCPGEFIVPIDCRNRSENPLDAYDPVVLGYPVYAWYQVPYAVPRWTSVFPVPQPRNINGIYYTSLWPLTSNLDQTLTFDPPFVLTKDFGWLSAMKFSGGGNEKPILNSIIVEPKNQWSALTGNLVYNPYYTPLTNYFAGAMLFRFKEDPSCSLNAWNSWQTVTITVAFATAAKVGDELSQGAVSGNIICINSPTSFVVVLSQGSGSFVPTPGPNIQNNATGNVSPPGVFSATASSPFRYDGVVESSIITTYDPATGAVTLNTPFSEDFDSVNDYFLIDFNTDPNNDWADFVTGGPRIFVPNGSNAQQAYEGLFFENYTLSSENNNMDFASQVIKYDRNRRLAYLDKVLPIKNITLPTNNGLYGSNTFTIRNELEVESKVYERISLTQGSIKELDIQNPGTGFKVGETIGTTFTTYFQAPAVAFAYPVPNYILTGNPGTAFRGTIASVDSVGGIISIEVDQQGAGYQRGTRYYLDVNSGDGKNAILIVPQIYQTLEIYRSASGDFSLKYPPGNYVFMPLFGQLDPTTGLQVTSSSYSAPSMPRYFFPPNTLGVTSATTLDIRQNGYPPRMKCLINSNYNVPESGNRQIVEVKTKTITFGDWWATVWAGSGTVTTPISTIYLQSPYTGEEAGLTDLGTPAFVNNVSIPGGFLVKQEIEFLEYSKDNMHPLNFTGTRVSQNQMVCFEIQLVSITLPNLPLDNDIGGLIALYPYLYVEFGNVIAPTRGNLGILYSNNPNANRVLFRVNVDDTNTPLRSSFIKLDGDGATQTVKFRPNDDLYFRVSLYNGKTFETLQKDTAPPLPPDFFVQISAEFEILRLI